MDLKQLIKFGLENSSDPVIKNPVLRAALEEPRSMAQGGRIRFQDGKDVHLDTMGRQNTTRIRKEKKLKSIFDDIFKADNFGAIRGARRGHGLIPDDWFLKHVSKAIAGDADALKDLSRITGREIKDLQNAFKQRNNPMMLTRSKAAAKSSARKNVVNEKFVELIKKGITDKTTLKETLKLSEDGFQDVVSLAFKQGYENRARLNKNPNNPLSSYFGSSSGADDAKRAIGEYDKLIEGFNKIDGIDKARERLITNRIQQVYGVDGSHPNSKMYKTMTDRVNEFYKLKKTLPKEIVMNLDHAIPMSLIEQLTEANTLRVNVQPITQSLNMGLKAQIDKAYSGAYKSGNKKVMRAIEEIAEKIDLPMGKITDTMIDLGKNPYLTGDMKQVIYNNLVIQNSITEKAGKLDKKLLKQAGLEGFNFDVGKVDTETVAKLFSEGDEKFTKFVSGVGKKVKAPGGFISTHLLKDIGKVGKKSLRFLASDWVWPEVLLGGAEYFNLKQKGAEHDRALSGAIEMSTLGLVDLQGTEKAIVDQARKLGYDDEAIKNLESLIKSKQIEKDIRGEYKNFEAIKANLEGENPDPRLNNWGMLDASEKRLEKLKNDYAGVQENFTGGEEVYKLFDDASKELARTEWNRSLEDRKTRLDPHAGGIGNWAQNEFFTIDPQTRQAMQEQIDAMSPEELELFNTERGIGEEKVHPLYGAGMSYKQMEPFYEEMDYMYKADGGIMSLKRK
jgi:lysophospholipase L1-like esterase